MSVDSVRPAFISPDVDHGRYLFLDLNPPPCRGLTLVGAGRERCTANYRIDRPGFDYHTVEFVTGGTWRLRHGGRAVDLRPGGLFAYGPGTAYSLEAEGGEERIKYFVNFTGDAAARSIAACGLDGCRVRYVRPLRWIHELFDQMLDCNQLDPDLACDIGTRINELILKRIISDARSDGERDSDRRQTFARCRAFINAHYLELDSVGEAARRCHVDPAYLARLFKRFANERPSHLLARLKTQHAGDLILRRGFNVSQAAAAVGYTDPYHFSRVFKRLHGIAPRTLRG